MVVETSIVITSSRERVWATLADIESWRHWNSVLRDVTTATGGPLAVGLRFRCRVAVFAVPIAFEAVVSDFVAGERIVWTSDWLGIRARHEFLCSSLGEQVRVISRERFSGATALVIGPFFPAWRVRQLTNIMLGDLKRAVEG